MNATSIRTFPKAKIDWLRFQVGQVELKVETIDNKPIRVQFFRLLGWGKTADEAFTRAGRPRNPQ
jgi:hypothetical protein